MRVVIDLRQSDPARCAPADEYARHLIAGLLEVGRHQYTILEPGSRGPLPAADVLLLPAGGTPRPGIRSVTCVPDLNHLLAARRMGVLASVRRGFAVAFTAHRADRLFAPSQYVAHALIRYLRVRKERVHVVPPGVEATFTRTSMAAADALRDELDLGDRYCVASGDRRLAEAAFGGAETPSDARLIHLESLRLPADRLPALLSGAVAVMLTDRACGCPIRALQAMACGSPPIAVADAAYPEVVRDGGLTPDPDDVEEWAGCISAVYRSTALRARLSQRAMQIAGALTARRAALAALPLLEPVGY
jgi:glycosyltransferase involved in cell wall biosynthesis